MFCCSLGKNTLTDWAAAHGLVRETLQSGYLSQDGLLAWGLLVSTRDSFINSQLFTVHLWGRPYKIVRVLRVNKADPVPALVELKIW